VQEGPEQQEHDAENECLPHPGADAESAAFRMLLVNPLGSLRRRIGRGIGYVSGNGVEAEAAIAAPESAPPEREAQDVLPFAVRCAPQMSTAALGAVHVLDRTPISTIVTEDQWTSARNRELFERGFVERTGEHSK